MKKTAMRSVLILVAVLALTTLAGAEQLSGNISSGSGPTWQASWIDLIRPTSFARGETLKITIRGNAEHVAIRLLPSGATPSSGEGVVGDIRKVPQDGVLLVQLPEERRNVVQISVHAGEWAWNINLGPKNGTVTLVGIERLPAP
jgi:proline racemase